MIDYHPAFTALGKRSAPQLRRVSDLEVHPFNLEIYGEPDDGLRGSIGEFGMQHPIVIDRKNRILSGARRWTAAGTLGWEEVETVLVELDGKAAARKYILLANAYRAAKPDYVRKLEADAYLGLLKAGDTTKDALRQLAEEQGTVTDGYKLDAPTALAAAAAGMSRMTYSRFRYVVDGGAERAIRKAEDAGEVTPGRAAKLRAELEAQADRLRRGKAGAQTADKALRAALAEARRQRSMSAQDVSRDRAIAAFDGALRKGNTFLKAIHGLAGDVKYLGRAQAAALATTLREMGAVAAELGRRQVNASPGGPEELVPLPPVNIPAHLHERLQGLSARMNSSLSTVLAKVLEGEISLHNDQSRRPPIASPLMGYDPQAGPSGRPEARRPSGSRPGPSFVRR